MNVANFHFLGFRERRINQSPEPYSSEVVRYPNGMAGGTIRQHTLNVGEIFRCRHLCNLFICDGVSDRHVIASRKRRYFTVQPFDFDSSGSQVWRLTWQLGKCFWWHEVSIPYGFQGIFPCQLVHIGLVEKALNFTSEFIKALTYLHNIDQNFCVSLPEAQKCLVHCATRFCDSGWSHAIHPPFSILFSSDQGLAGDSYSSQEPIARDRILEGDQDWMVFQIDGRFGHQHHFPRWALPVSIGTTDSLISRRRIQRYGRQSDPQRRLKQF